MLARHFVVLSFTCLGLVVLAALACSAPVDTGPGSPAAAATDVRHTEVARVQIIISNPSTPTPTPAATDTPTPTCPNAIWWNDARTHVGEVRSVQGTLVATRAAPAGGQLLEVGLPYPDPLGLAIVLGSGDASALAGKSVCATGQIRMLEGRPTLQLQDATGVKLVD
ncbi:MAG: hypothetical protein JO057_30150 [Chloroflexi bacterium]|nr:hypothetical protein [Chloroflexota bacterium]